MNKNIIDLNKLKELSKICIGDILKMTTLAKSGHPGGSMSSLTIYLCLYYYANINPQNKNDEERDRIIISHGHTAPGIYAVLGRFGFFNTEEAIAYFRKAGSIFEGHIEPEVPGIEWATGNLGQGLSAACGFALAGKQKGIKYNVYTVMGDGEQQKGQITEARRFALKYGLNNITVLIDLNKLQISGDTECVMPQNIKENYLSDGWQVMEVNGHNINGILKALKKANENTRKPTAIIAKTTMGYGVSFMENDETYHGKALTEEQLSEALKELDIENDLEHYKALREKFVIEKKRVEKKDNPIIKKGNAIKYDKDKSVANRDAYGNALVDLLQINHNKQLAVFDCDLAGSVRTKKFSEIKPDFFYQGGIQEHNTAVIAGAMSKENIVTFYSDFGVFGIDETYNQQRLNDINKTNLKLVTTHVGLNVGEDGKTHQCIDYIGIMSNLFGFKIIIPADANQTDIIIRYIASVPGNFLVPMGRAKTKIITKENKNIYYDENYKFNYGKADKIRSGKDSAIFTTGVMVEKGIEVHEILKKHGINISVWNFSCISDISKTTLGEAASCPQIFISEDHNINTGLGSIIESKINEFNINTKIVKFGVTQYGSSGSYKELYKLYKLDSDSIAERIRIILSD